MTVNTIETVKSLIEEMESYGTPVGSAWEYTNTMNNKIMFAVFAAAQPCDIYDSLYVKDPECIWSEGKFIGKYKNLN